MPGTKAGRLLAVMIATVLVLAVLAGTERRPAEAAQGVEASAAVKARVQATYGKLPLHFEANQGQTGCSPASTLI